MSFLLSSRRSRISFLAGSVCLVLLYGAQLRWFQEHQERDGFGAVRQSYSWHNHPEKEDITRAAQNATLGFEKIYYISLPHRTDRQDMMTLLATSTNLKLQLQPGVNGSNVAEKAKPSEAGGLRPEQLGCWRSHADAWQRVIEDDVQTAIILEDDADWDVNIHDIFQEMSVQMRKGELRKERPTPEEIKNAPYGLDWDILYIGSCWDIPNMDNRPKHQTWDDPNAPNKKQMSGSFLGELEGWGVKMTDSTRVRVLAPSWYPVCTIGYAVTRRGAEKLLYTVGSGLGIGSPIDLTLTDRIQKGYLRAYTVVPPLVTPWKSGTVSDSDIDDLADKSTEELFHGSENLKNSARRAMDAKWGTPVNETWGYSETESRLEAEKTEASEKEENGAQPTERS